MEVNIRIEVNIVKSKCVNKDLAIMVWIFPNAVFAAPFSS